MKDSSFKVPQGAVYAGMPAAPLSVFSEGPWIFKETGENFSGTELDVAAFVAYRNSPSMVQVEDSVKEIINLIDTFAELRHTQGHWTYNEKSQEARNAVIAALKGE